jgi:hypothetical protein
MLENANIHSEMKLEHPEVVVLMLKLLGQSYQNHQDKTIVAIIAYSLIQLNRLVCLFPSNRASLCSVGTIFTVMTEFEVAIRTPSHPLQVFLLSFIEILGQYRLSVREVCVFFFLFFFYHYYYYCFVVVFVGSKIF